MPAWREIIAGKQPRTEVPERDQAAITSRALVALEGLGSDWTVRHWSRQTLDAKHYPYSIDQLHNLAEKAQALMRRVIGFEPKA